MYEVRYFSRWNGYSNEYESEKFNTLEEAKAFASGKYDTSIYEIVPSIYPNSKWMRGNKVG